MNVLLPEADTADLIAQEEQLRAQEEASTLFLDGLLREAEEIRIQAGKGWETCPMI